MLMFKIPKFKCNLKMSRELFIYCTLFCTGNYLYLEASGHHNNDYAVLLSPIIPPTGMSGYCFTLWYHMFGPNIGVFSVYSMIGGKKILQFTKRGTQGNQWKQAVINVNSTTDFQVCHSLGLVQRSKLTRNTCKMPVHLKNSK